jgi:holo-[acyl-carrier protein] synthase
MAGAGIDLLEIERLERALDRRPRLAQRLFTPGELTYSSSRARPGQHLAARFCAKEAVAKALGLTVWSPRDVEILSGAQAADVALHGSAGTEAARRGVSVAVSMTHNRSTAGAVAVLRGP